TLLRGTKAVQAALAPQLQAGPTPPGDEAGPAPPPPPTPSGPSVGDAPPPDAKRPRPSVLRRTATPPGPSVLQKLLATQAGSSRHGSGVQRAKYALKPSPGLLHWLMRDESALADIGTLVRGSLSTKPRMLIVAPSNTAVDNIIPYMDMPDDRLLVAEQRLVKDVHGLTQALAQLKHAAVTECRRQVAAALQRGAGEEERSAVAEGVAQAHAGHLLDLAKKHFAVAAELRRLKLVRRCRASGLRTDVGAARDALRQECLAEAELVFATLSSSARSEIGEYTDASGLAFDVVVVDEAGQCTEASSLVPLQHGAQQLVLVGDPQQLPATVLSREAAEAGLDRSLFARLAEAGHVVHLLDTQYRMHPDIAAFPSKHFYEGRVGDAASVCGPARQQLWHALPLMAPLRLLNVRIGAASTGTGGTSYSNLAEARAALALAAGL
ncbi:SEN1, partial [Symbiodinium sp. KB8]